MPNWCNNVLQISATKEIIDKIKLSINKKEPDLFNTFVPEPKGKDSDWLEWRLKNWGTKWDAVDFIITASEDTTIDLEFDTAWSPPLDFYRNIEKMGCKVVAFYYEPGCAFAGEYDEGENTLDLAEEDDEYFTNTSLGKSLDRMFCILEDRQMTREQDED